MPRTTAEIAAHADELARRFEEADPAPGAVRDATALRLLSHAVIARSQADQVVAVSVELARNDGHSWAAIGAMLGTSGQAARERYGPQESSGKQ